VAALVLLVAVATILVLVVATLSLVSLLPMVVVTVPLVSLVGELLRVTGTFDSQGARALRGRAPVVVITSLLQSQRVVKFTCNKRAEST